MGYPKLSFFFLLTSLSLSASGLPNIIILYADDMGVADVSYGDGTINFPPNC